MVQILIRIPKEILDKLDKAEESLNTAICQILAAHAGVEYVPPKRGGRRLPKELTPEEAQAIANQIAAMGFRPMNPDQIISSEEAWVNTHLPDGTPVNPPKTTGAQHATPLKLNMETLAQQGYPYAEQENGLFTGKLSHKALGGYTYVGKMTLGEFQRRAGKKAFTE